MFSFHSHVSGPDPSLRALPTRGGPGARYCECCSHAQPWQWSTWRVTEPTGPLAVLAMQPTGNTRQIELRLEVLRPRCELSASAGCGTLGSRCARSVRAAVRRDAAVAAALCRVRTPSTAGAARARRAPGRAGGLRGSGKWWVTTHHECVQSASATLESLDVSGWVVGQLTGDALCRLLKVRMNDAACAEGARPVGPCVAWSATAAPSPTVSRPHCSTQLLPK